MKNVLLLVSVAVAFAGCSASPSSDSANNSQTPASTAVSKSGNGIVDEYLRREAAPFRKQRVRFTITSEDEPVKIYEVENWRKQTDAETLTLTQIVRPAEDTDLASLTVEKKGEPAKVTTFVASQNDFRETDTNRMFFGGLTAGELLGEWSKFDFRQVSENELNGARVYELDGKLRKDASGTVERMVVMMRAAEPIPVELRLFDAGNVQIRTFRSVEFRSDSHGAYTTKTEVDNPVYKTKIVIEILSREFPETAPDAMFSRDKLREIATRKK